MNRRKILTSIPAFLASFFYSKKLTSIIAVPNPSDDVLRLRGIDWGFEKGDLFFISMFKKDLLEDICRKDDWAIQNIKSIFEHNAKDFIKTIQNKEY